MPTNSKKVQLERLANVSKLYLRGIPQYKIAERLKCSPAQVSKDLKKLAQQWKASAEANIDEVMQRELAKIDNLEMIYHDAWEKSCGKKTTRRQKKKIGGDQVKVLGKGKKSPEFKNLFTENMQSEEEMLGDPRYLSGIQWCIQMRNEILGYGAAKKIDLTSKGEKMPSGAVIILPSNGREIDFTSINNDKEQEDDH